MADPRCEQAALPRYEGELRVMRSHQQQHAGGLCECAGASFQVRLLGCSSRNELARGPIQPKGSQQAPNSAVSSMPGASAAPGHKAGAAASTAAGPASAAAAAGGGAKANGPFTMLVGGCKLGGCKVCWMQAVLHLSTSCGDCKLCWWVVASCGECKLCWRVDASCTPPGRCCVECAFQSCNTGCDGWEAGRLLVSAQQERGVLVHEALACEYPNEGASHPHLTEVLIKVAPVTVPVRCRIANKGSLALLGRACHAIEGQDNPPSTTPPYTHH
eukprot:1138166-Pelagomonas_calceolata.AAC.2